MNDLILWGVASVTTLTAHYLGINAGRRRERRDRKDRVPKEVKPVCGCSHSLSMHDPDTNRCFSKVNGKAFRWDHWEEATAWERVQCDCRQYVGPRPLDSFYAPRFTLPTSEDS